VVSTFFSSLCLAQELVAGAAAPARHQALEGQVADDVRVVLPLEEAQPEPLSQVLLRGGVEHLVPHLEAFVREAVENQKCRARERDAHGIRGGVWTGEGLGRLQPVATSKVPSERFPAVRYVIEAGSGKLRQR